MSKAAVISTGKYVPEKILTNEDLEKMVDTSDEWITTRTGIKERRIVSDGETNSTLACNAARDALSEAGMDPRDIDMIIVATFTPDRYLAATACKVQDMLGAVNSGAVDLAAACTGYVYGLSMAAGYVATGIAENILVIGSEVLSRFTNWKDRNTCVLFGDGAGAMLIGPSQGKHELEDFVLKSDGSGWELLSIPGGGSENPPSLESVSTDLHAIHMNGREIFKFAVSKLEWLIREAARLQGVEPTEIDKVVPHQVNYRIVKSACARLGMEPERFFLNLEKYGNTSGASIPLAFDEALDAGFIEDGDIVVLPGFGGGLTYGMASVRW
ncbi:MAG: ketoacyl-ACP synthase III [Planctomycetes bacterium]|nr:ketoacyl-ACP synthase III [Planctomycetota bacterium]